MIYSIESERRSHEEYVTLLKRYMKLRRELRRLRKCGEFSQLAFGIQHRINSLRTHLMHSRKFVTYNLHDARGRLDTYASTCRASCPCEHVKRHETLYDINDVPSLRWVPWPEVSSDVAFTSVVAGIGSGERRVAALFGGTVMGSRMSYDVFVPGRGCWEVKDVTSNRELRATVSGVRSYAMLHARIIYVTKQLSNIAAACASLSMSPAHKKMLAYITWFVQTNSRCIFDGEISKERFIELKRAVEFAAVLKHVIPKLGDVLNDEAFNNPSSLVNEVNGIKASSSFDMNVVGIVLVHRKMGFYVIPRHDIDVVLQFSRVSQGKPKFKFIEVKDDTKRRRRIDQHGTHVCAR